MFYLYALPQGTLARQLQIFRGICERNFGKNPAHDYPLHCTLTKGFVADEMQAEDYRDAITRHFAGARQPTLGSFRHVANKQLVLLELEAPDLAISSESWVSELDRKDIEVKTANFHITIASETRHHVRIFELVQEAAHPTMEIHWEVSLCERMEKQDGDSEWIIPAGLRLC